MKYFVNAPARRSKSRSRTGRKKPRSAAQKAATKKMRAALAAKKARSTSAKRKKRATTRRSPTVARRKKKGGARRRSTTKRRRRSTVKRRSPVTRLRRHAVYSTNPRKRRRRSRSRYHRNPSYVKQAIQIGKDTAAVVAGGAVGRTIGGMLPSFGNPIAEAAKGILIAIAIRMAAARFLGADVARFAAAGAMQVPLKNLVVGFVPQAAPFLGDYDLAMLSSYSGAGALSSGDEGAGMGSYAPFMGMTG